MNTGNTAKESPAFESKSMRACWLFMTREDYQQRFWSRVQKSDGCWTWTSSLSQCGYGTLKLEGCSVLAHRLSYLQHYRFIADDLCVCHRCDNPRCVNPAHLFIATHAENMADMRAKGRRKGVTNGARNGRARLTEAQVTEIRQRLARGEYANHIARDYGVGHNTIYRIRSGETWKQ